MSQGSNAKDFKHIDKVATIVGVNAQNKTVDIVYLNQGGGQTGLNIPYTTVSSTWGILHMPMIGDRVIINNADGEMPVIKSMFPKNTQYLPYLDPGEMSMLCENGSFLQLKNRRKKVQSTGQLIAYDATAGPNGETDLEYEPGGLVLRARSKQQQDNETPRWYNHSYISMFDNGNVAIQAMNNSVPKALIHMEGTTGHSWWHAGDGKVQEYIELDPVKKEIVILSDGDVHQHSIADWKVTAYQDNVINVGGIIQIKSGVIVSSIPADFDQIKPDTDLNPGDIRIDNTGTVGAKLYLHVSGDCDITVDQGDVNLNVTQGALNINLGQGGVNLVAHDAVNITTTADVTLQTSEGDVTVSTQSGDVSVNSDAGDVDIHGSNVNISADIQISLSAPHVSGA
jgi:hypothetical protein